MPKKKCQTVKKVCASSESKNKQKELFDLDSNWTWSALWNLRLLCVQVFFIFPPSKLLQRLSDQGIKLLHLALNNNNRRWSEGSARVCDKVRKRSTWNAAHLRKCFLQSIVSFWAAFVKIFSSYFFFVHTILCIIYFSDIIIIIIHLPGSLNILIIEVIPSYFNDYWFLTKRHSLTFIPVSFSLSHFLAGFLMLIHWSVLSVYFLNASYNFCFF